MQAMMQSAVALAATEKARQLTAAAEQSKLAVGERAEDLVGDRRR
jgi:hypothetical protein